MRRRPGPGTNRPRGQPPPRPNTSTLVRASAAGAAEAGDHSRAGGTSAPPAPLSTRTRQQMSQVRPSSSAHADSSGPKPPTVSTASATRGNRPTATVSTASAVEPENTGAGEGNRTLVSSLEGYRSTIELRPLTTHERHDHPPPNGSQKATHRPPSGRVVRDRVGGASLRDTRDTARRCQAGPRDVERDRVRVLRVGTNPECRGGMRDSHSFFAWPASGAGRETP